VNRFLRASVALHVAAACSVAVRRRTWRVAAGAVLADQLLLTGAGMVPTCDWLGPNLTRLPPGPRLRQVGLSFDDGPDPLVTPVVLDLLDGAGMQASFFCIGARARRHPALVGEIVRRGHRVENHSEHHRWHFACLPLHALRREILLAQQVLGELAGRPPTWFRAPMGLRSPLLQPVLEQTGLHLASWTRRALDGVRGDAAAGSARLLRGLAADDLLLLHDGNCARTSAGRPAVLEILPELLGALRARGLCGVALPDPGDARPF